MSMLLKRLVMWVGLVGVFAWPASGQGAYLDESLTAQEEIEVARLLIQEGRIEDAVATLDRVVAEHANKVLKTDAGVFVDTQLRVRQLVAANDRLLLAYQTQNEASAQRALLLALEDGAAPAQLEQVLHRYQLTASGLEAGLVLAGRYLEQAEANAAVSVLSEIADHPQIETRRAQWLSLSATGAALRADRAAHEEAVESLRKLDAAAAERLALSGEALLGRDQEASAAPEALPRRDAALWSSPLVDAMKIDAEAEARMTRAERLELDRLRRMQQSMQRPAPVPAMSGSRVLINTGRSVRAFDRDSGRSIWTHAREQEPARTTVQELQRQRLMLTYTRGGETRGVAVAGRRAYAVLGQSSATIMRFGVQQDAPDSELVALGLGDGRQHWMVKPTDLAPAELGGAIFIGTPQIEGSQLYVLARRTKGASHDHFLVCLDTDTGRFHWLRHVLGVSNQRRGAPPSPPTVYIKQGRVFVGDGQQTIVCIDTRTGSVRWARMFTGEIETPGRREVVHRSTNPQRMAPTPQAVLTDAGLLMPVDLKNDHAVLLDQDTGAIIKRMSRDLDESTYWQVFDGGLVSVGPSVVRYELPQMKPKWRTAVGSDDERLVGRPVIVGDQLLVPTAKGALSYGLADGKVTRRIAAMANGNLAYSGGVLLCAQNKRLVAIDDWPRAQARLTARAEAAPTDPEPGLALAHLALRLNESEAVLGGVDLAILALDERLMAGDLSLNDPVHSRVFRQLLDFTDARFNAKPDLREQLFDRVASMTSGPADEVAYHLARGAYLSEPEVARYADAVEHYQSILAAPDLTEQAVAYQGYDRHAGLEAGRRLARLVEEQGRTVYARFDALATTQLNDLLASSATADRLIALANRYPLSAAAPMAHFEAGVRLIAEGSPGAAVGQLRLAFAHATDDDLRARAAGALATHYQDAGQPDRAVRWLQRVRLERPGLPVVRDGQLVEPGSWIADLRTLPVAPAHLPRLGASLGEPTALPGRLVQMHRAQADASAPAGLLTIDGQILRYYSAADQAPRWERTVADPDFVALAISDEQVLLWSADRGEVVALDGRTGQPQWPARSAGALLLEVTDEDRLPEDQDRADPLLIEMIQQNNNHARRLVVNAAAPQRTGRTAMVRVSPSVICLANNEGKVVGIDRHTGTVLWRLRSPVDDLDGLTIGTDALAIAGRTRGAEVNHAGRLVIVDLITGKSRLPIQHIGADLPQWSAFTGTNKFVCLTDRHLAAYDLHHGAVAWRRDRAELRLLGTGWSSDRLLVMPDLAGIAQFIDPDTGQTLQSVSTRSRTRSEPTAAAIFDRNVYLLSAGSLVASSERATLWRDAVAEDQRAFVGQFIAQDHAVILAQNEGGPGPNTEANPEFALFLLERTTGRLVSQYRLPRSVTAVDLTASRVIDGHLILTTPDRVLAFPARD